MFFVSRFLFVFIPVFLTAFLKVPETGQRPRVLADAEILSVARLMWLAFSDCLLGVVWLTGPLCSDASASKHSFLAMTCLKLCFMQDEDARPLLVTSCNVPPKLCSSWRPPRPIFRSVSVLWSPFGCYSIAVRI